MLPSADDHVAISDLLARYCLTLDLDDVDGWVSLFTPDAGYQVYGRVFSGHDGLRAMMGAAPGGIEDGVGEGREIVGDQRFLRQAEGEQGDAGGEIVIACAQLAELRDQVVVAHDGAGDQVREIGDEQRVIQQAVIARLAGIKVPLTEMRPATPFAAAVCAISGRNSGSASKASIRACGDLTASPTA